MWLYPALYLSSVYMLTYDHTSCCFSSCTFLFTFWVLVHIWHAYYMFFQYVEKPDQWQWKIEALLWGMLCVCVFQVNWRIRLQVDLQTLCHTLLCVLCGLLWKWTGHFRPNPGKFCFALWHSMVIWFCYFYMTFSPFTRYLWKRSTNALRMSVSLTLFSTWTR